MSNDARLKALEKELSKRGDDGKIEVMVWGFTDEQAEAMRQAGHIVVKLRWPEDLSHE